MVICCLSERLRELRLERNFTQEIVAERIFVTRGMVSAYENGLRQCSLEILVKFARLYHVTTDYLLGLENTRPIVIYGLSERQAAIINDMADILDESNQEKTASAAMREVV